jgi:predicted DNA-binding protein with PD1-like motif
MQKWLFIISISFIISCKSNNMSKPIAFRLKPGADLKLSLDSLVKEHSIKAGWMVTCVGSLTAYHMRYANQTNGSKGIGHFEIVSLVGTLSTNGSHLHIAVADSTGKTIGGHLLEGCKVYTTAEIVIASSSEYLFTRKEDGSTPWKELQVEKVRER